ncbi:class I SAM-dependent methyltransferase [Vicingus serpentipes]|uniref:Class I SAM-dependent methyltransferase n=1 Tax=Vicingus serpentipes TaxID=1926625 RepID=A0A5C6RUT5_9FLAO|nr:class I SAM-dependent methyltransferase [Vicingus serpentipes]TXB65794.1 class I SAM-dependent methyltransferase [Vicingus serpentipes]
MNSTDALGEALKDVYFNSAGEDIIVISDIAEDDIIPTDYLFRNYKQMPKLERKALDLCFGDVIDVGAASGSHSLYLQEKGIKVKAIDISIGAIDVMKARNIENAELIDFFELKEEKFDTILLLMNGIGIAGTIEKLPEFLNQCKSLLNPKGQVLLDSSDIAYMFEEEDGSKWVDVNKNYHGEVVYQMQYKNTITEKFNWLFLDFNTLKNEAKKLGLKTEKVIAGSHFDFLARLTLE